MIGELFPQDSPRLEEVTPRHELGDAESQRDLAMLEPLHVVQQHDVRLRRRETPKGALNSRPYVGADRGVRDPR